MQILGKSQLFPEIPRKIQQALLSVGRMILNVLRWGVREESCPHRQEGLVWVLTVTCGLGQVSVPSQPPVALPVKSWESFLALGLYSEA